MVSRVMVTDNPSQTYQGVTKPSQTYLFYLDLIISLCFLNNVLLMLLLHCDINVEA